MKDNSPKPYIMMGMKIIALNRRAKHDYQLGQRLVAGLVLAGHEVKSIKAGQVSLKGSFIHFVNQEAWLSNAHVRLYSSATNIPAYDPTRPRKLLMKRKELDQLAGSKGAEGMTIVPTAIGLDRGLIKLELAVGRGKKHYDKREAQKKLAMERDASVESKRHFKTNVKTHKK